MRADRDESRNGKIPYQLALYSVCTNRLSFLEENPQSIINSAEFNEILLKSLGGFSQPNCRFPFYQELPFF
jgi:hypothetical protein